MHTTRRQLAGVLGAMLGGCAIQGRGRTSSTPEPVPPSPEVTPPARPATTVERFFTAIEEGQAHTVAAMLRVEPGLLTARDSQARTPFTLAVLSDRDLVAEVLLAHGYRLDLTESAWAGDWPRFAELAGAHPEAIEAGHPLGATVMIAAAHGGRGHELWRVYAVNASPNPARPDPTTPSPLRAALDVRSLATAELTAATLLANGADPNAREPSGHTALHAAAARGSVELVELLLRKGADIDAHDDHGRRPLDLAPREGPVVDMLEGRAPVPRDHVALRRAFDVDHRPYRPVAIDDLPVDERAGFVGLGHARFDELRGRLAAEPRLVHAQATNTEMAVDAAGHTGRVDIVEHLLAHGAPLSMVSAAVLGDVRLVARLLDAAPERIHERGPHDFALLWYASIGGGNLDMAQLLIDRGARVETQHYLGTTALHFAALAGQVELAALLLAHGARIDRPGRKFGGEPQTPLQLAVAAGQASMATFLRDRGGRDHD
jgi:ankyrin repeat protein